MSEHVVFIGFSIVFIVGISFPVGVASDPLLAVVVALDPLIAVVVALDPLLAVVVALDPLFVLFAAPPDPWFVVPVLLDWVVFVTSRAPLIMFVPLLDVSVVPFVALLDPSIIPSVAFIGKAIQ